MSVVKNFLYVYLVALISVDAFIDYFDNDLAKVCRPVDRPLDLLFILDGSGSVGDTTFETQIQMLNRVIDMVDIGEDKTKIAVMQYASYTYVEFLFKTYKDKASVREAVKAIRHKLGTTKTGKALDKAAQLFNDPSSGSRRGISSGKHQNIAQVAIVVSDGHSHDDPIPAALRLRQAGAHLIALGIGPHVNAAELLQLTSDPELVFENLSQPQQAAHFAETLRMRFAISEACEYSRGIANDGADVQCEKNGARVSVTTRAPFGGHFYVQEHYHDSKCRWSSSSTTNVSENSTNNSGNKTPTNISNEGGSELSLFVPFDECGVDHQFSVNPKGIIFQANVVLQFHPIYSTALDKTFKIHCFYQDKSSEQNGEIDWQLIKEHTQRKIRKDKKIMPCSLKIIRDENSDQHSVNFSSPFSNDCGGLKNENSNFYLGEPVLFKWECNSDNFDTYQSMLVHSCYMIDERTKQRDLIIDRNGCSLAPILVETPRYSTSLTAISRAFAFRKADNPFFRITCSLRFCDRLMDECSEILPPKCSRKAEKEDSTKILNNEDELLNRRRRRQAGIPISVRSLNAENFNTNSFTGPPPLVTFDRSKLDKNRQQQRVVAVVNSQARIRNIGPNEIRLSTQDVKVIGELPAAEKLSSTINQLPNEADTNIEKVAETEQKPQNEEDDGELPPNIAKTLKQHGIDVKDPIDSKNKAVSDDPFQQEIQRNIATAAEEKHTKLIVGELDANLLRSINLDEIDVQSQIINIQTRSESSCVISRHSLPYKCLSQK